MKIEQKIIYRCDHCNKYYLSKYHCKNHERICFKNPSNFRACYNCSNLEKKETVIYSDGQNEYGYVELKRKVSLFYCQKIDCFLIPHTAELKGNYFETGDILNDYMKRKCEFQKEFGAFVE